MNTYESGREGEDRAASYLQERGYRILKRNYRAFSGEVDIVAVRGERLVFVEVKSWNTIPASEIGYSINRMKMIKIRRTSAVFLHDFPEYEGYRIRYDVLFLSDRTQSLHHIENAFDGD